jgi:peptidoglycan hydrolase-like protein with peptidoglycan-binding domain
MTAAAAAATLTVGTAGWAIWSNSQPQPAATGTPDHTTVQVISGDMVAETRATGRLQYTFTLPVIAGAPGTVTELPVAGATVAPGGVLYRIDTRPVILLRGTAPAWRDFSTDMTRGEDIRQLEANLKSFGFFAGEPDDRFTWDTAAAVRAWQKSLGVEQTGSVNRSTVLFADQDLRVSALETRVGAQVGEGTPLYSASGTDQTVLVDLKSANRELAVPGTPVTVSLPTGSDVEGTVSTVGDPAEKPGADGTGTSVVIPVRIDLASQDALSGLALSTVTVRFSSTLQEDALTVPIDALLPLDDETFAVELPRRGADGGRELVPVTVGAFASGNVAISGEGIEIGTDVVVPRR